ncbi:MAG: hypothetical protein K2O34_04215 [Acetatifactor sp.]|nr:hypothetical protein [Acetatifactor sp.]
MSPYIWHKSNYKLRKGKWGIAILLEAGYRELSGVTDLGQYRRLADRIYFQSTTIPYPQQQCSQTMLDSELERFCDGLKMAAKYIYPVINIAEDAPLLIDLRYIAFSICDIQEEAFTAAAIQWASEAFHFPMPHIGVRFDPERTADGWNGKYVYDFSNV